MTSEYITGEKLGCAAGVYFPVAHCLCRIVSSFFENQLPVFAQVVRYLIFVVDQEDWLQDPSHCFPTCSQEFESLSVIRATIIVIVQQLCQNLGYML